MTTKADAQPLHDHLAPPVGSERPDELRPGGSHPRARAGARARRRRAPARPSDPSAARRRRRRGRARAACVSASSSSTQMPRSRARGSRGSSAPHPSTQSAATGRPRCHSAGRSAAQSQRCQRGTDAASTWSCTSRSPRPARPIRGRRRRAGRVARRAPPRDSRASVVLPEPERPSMSTTGRARRQARGERDAASTRQPTTGFQYPVTTDRGRPRRAPTSDRDGDEHEHPLGPPNARLAGPGRAARAAEAAGLHRGRERAAAPDREHEQGEREPEEAAQPAAGRRRRARGGRARAIRQSSTKEPDQPERRRARRARSGRADAASGRGRRRGRSGRR